MAKTIPTMDALLAAIKAEHKTDGLKTQSAADANAAVRETFLTAAAHAAATADKPEEFTGATMVRLYFGNKMPEGRALISRTTDWNTVIAAGRANLDLVKAIWPTREETEKENKGAEKARPNVVRATFLKGCVAIKDKAVSTRDGAFKVMFAKKEADKAFNLANLENANEGDVLAAIKALGIQLMKVSSDTFEVFADDLISFQSKYNAGRKEGKFSTSAELAARNDDEPEEMTRAAA